jgi:hypothetical protein
MTTTNSATSAVLPDAVERIIDRETDRIGQALAGPFTAWRRAIIRDRVKAAVKAAIGGAL